MSTPRSDRPNRLMRAASLLRPRALAERARSRAQLLERQERLIHQVEALTSEVQLLAAKLDTTALKEQQLRAVMVSDVDAEDRVLGFHTMLGGVDLAQHIRKAVRKAELHLDPFPYCIVDGLFPRAYYHALIDGIPPVELFGDRPVNKQQLVVPFHFAPKYSRVVWSHMADVAATDMIAPALVEKFHEPLTEWLRYNFPALGSDPLRTIEMKCSDGRIMLRRPGYRILPHRDPKWGFVTCLMYLARSGDEPRWGTQIFRVKEDQQAQGASPHWIPDEQCEFVTDVEFVPNRALVFLNSVGAHGAHIPADAQPPDLERYTYQFRVGPERQSMEAIRSTLSAEQQPLWAGKVSHY